MSDTTVVIGIDVGGTNTDAVVIDKTSGSAKVLSGAKTLTTADISSGVREAIRLALLKLEGRYTKLAVQQVNIGTTHFINAVVEGKRLAKVSVIRLCGTSSRRLPPFSDFPEDIAEKLKASVFMANGGYQFDGQIITPVDKTEILSILETLKKNGESQIVVSGIFSPIRPDQEDAVVEIIHEHYPEASVTASKSIGRIGLLERENAAILNECIKPLCSEAIKGFRESLKDLGLHCPMYLTQNDGTVMSEEMALQFPVHTFASGATNSMRGAAFLSGLQDALVVDIGGTSTDVGVLTRGFPRHASAEVKIGGIRTNFRMPDVISIGLGGGSYVKQVQNKVKVGPRSAGFNIVNEAFVFAKEGNLQGREITATDIAVAAGITEVGDVQNVKSITKEIVDKGVDTYHQMIADCLDHMRFNDRDLPLILVGGGSILVGRDRKFTGISSVIKPEYFDVANAVGAALSQISSSLDKTVDLQSLVNQNELDAKMKEELDKLEEKTDKTCAKAKEQVRKGFLTVARDKALEECIELVKEDVIKNGGIKDTINLLDKEDIPLSYIPGDITRIKAKVVAELRADPEKTELLDMLAIKSKESYLTDIKGKQTVSVTGHILEETELVTTSDNEPHVDKITGEWILDAYDIECISIGAGIQGCGGGGNPHIGKISALKALKDGKQMRVLTPSKFFKTSEQGDMIVVVAVFGAPVAFYEKLLSGTEHIGALECMQDLYNVGKYKDSKLHNDADVLIQEDDGLIWIEDYKQTEAKLPTEIAGRKVAAVMSGEIGGMNCLEPLVVAADLNLPVLDADGMGRAFPQVQMFAPFMYDCDPYPSTLADDKGNRSVVLKTRNPKQLEECFRRIVMGWGCTGGIAISNFNEEQVTKYTIHHSLSFAWRIGHTILKARKENKPPVEEMIKCTNGKLLMNGKITDVKRELTGGYSMGVLKIDGLEDYAEQKLTIEFQNEFLIARLDTKNGQKGEILACVPDLITILDIDSALPIPTEEVHFGMRVCIVAMPVAPLMATDKALKWVGPQAFGYPDDVKYIPLSKYPAHDPVGPV